jgi:hypothetical protein
MKSIKSFYLSISVLILLISFNGCDSTTNAFNIFSDADDVQLGLDVVAEINANPTEYPIFNGDESA